MDHRVFSGVVMVGSICAQQMCVTDTAKNFPPSAQSLVFFLHEKFASFVKKSPFHQNVTLGGNPCMRVSWGACEFPFPSPSLLCLGPTVCLDKCLMYFRMLDSIILVRSTFVDNWYEIKGFKGDLVFPEIFRSSLRGKINKSCWKPLKPRDIVLFHGKLLLRNIL